MSESTTYIDTWHFRKLCGSWNHFTFNFILYSSFANEIKTHNRNPTAYVLLCICVEWLRTNTNEPSNEVNSISDSHTKHFIYMKLKMLEVDLCVVYFEFESQI